MMNIQTEYGKNAGYKTGKNYGSEVWQEVRSIIDSPGENTG
jgi:hypothetical protein